MASLRAVRTRNGNFELWSWLFMRISGVLILVLVLTHLAIMHVSQPITNITFSFVAGRWAIPAWRWFDLALLGLALVHGLNGTRVVLDDYIHARGWRLTAMSLLWTVGIVFLLVGATVALTFQSSIR